MTPRSKSMTAGCTAGATAVRALMDFAVARGCDRKVLAERSGIDPVDLLDEEGRIPFDRYIALMKAGQESCDDPAFALHFGESDEGAERSLACMMGIFSPTVRESFEQRIQNPAPPESTERYEFTRDGDDLWIIDTRDIDFPQAVEASFAR